MQADRPPPAATAVKAVRNDRRDKFVSGIEQTPFALTLSEMIIVPLISGLFLFYAEVFPAGIFPDRQYCSPAEKKKPSGAGFYENSKLAGLFFPLPVLG